MAPRPGAAPTAEPWWRRFFVKKRLSLAVAAIAGLAAIVIVIGAVMGLRGRGTEPDGDPPPETADAKPRRSRKTKSAAREAEPPQFKTRACKITTPEPGFFVLVDGELARDDEGRKLTTPCEVGIPKGNHTLTIVRRKYHDHSEELTLSAPKNLNLAPTFEPFAEPTGFFTSRLALAEVWQPIELEAVNAGGPAWDPILSADGLSLWFAGQKSEGKGIYVARRANLISDFGPPELVSKNSDRLASPSLTDDRLVLAYAVPAKAQIRSLVRNDPDSPFKLGPPLRSSEQDDERWLSAQIAADGKTLYFSQELGEKIAIQAVKRKSARSKFDGEAHTIRMPGGHPRLTRDGLRQFSFDGKTLFRSSRWDLESAFTDPEPIGTLDLEGYEPRPEYRQYFVTDDEQWLYWSDDPQETGKLFAVRIAPGPRWGFAPRGKKIEQREVAQDSKGLKLPTPEPEKVDEDTSPSPAVEARTPDPRTLPLPYAEFRTKLEKVLAIFDYAVAEKMIAEALRDPKLSGDKGVLAWDRDDVQRLARFLSRVEESVAQLKPGEPVKAAGLQLEFVSYADGRLTGKVRGSDKSVTRSLFEFPPGDLVALVDKRVDRNDEAAQFEIATFLAQFPKVSPQLVQVRFERAGPAGKEAADRRELRVVHGIEQEIARDNLGVALQQIDQLVAGAPRSKAAAQARELRDSMYKKIAWRQVGRQSWNTSTPGEFATTGGKSPGAYLATPGEFRSFLLALEWKTTGETSAGGVYFHYRSGDLRKNAFKVHLAGDYAFRNNLDWFSTGSLLGIKAPKSNAVKPNGEWNTLTLRVEGETVKAAINGVDVLESIASGKSVPAEGLICLDGEFSGISYRKVLVYELLAPKN